MKPGTAATNRFSGKHNDSAQMNPGHGNPNKVKRTGPVDTDVWVLALQTPDHKPLAVLANYSTHYAGAPAVSDDYFGVFAKRIGELIGADKSNPDFVGIMSNGTSGDANCYDFDSQNRREFDRFTVGEDTAQAAWKAYQKIEFHEHVSLDMLETKLTLNVRMPTGAEVAEAREFAKTFANRLPKTVEEVYARETLLLHDMPPTRELKLQVLRIGDLVINTIPNEVFGSTGLTLKEKSPFRSTFNIELANGAEGYIPPPDQHKLGGYTTWRARTSCLEEEAEPKIVAALVQLMRQLHEKNAGTSPVPSPLSPKDSLHYFHIKPGFRIELVAAEPLIEDPVAFDWADDGKLWVVEMHDYPLGISSLSEQRQRVKANPKTSWKGSVAGGRVRFLEDTDGDGRYDKSTLFADDLVFPNGICAWRDGVLVTTAPHIVYLEDTNGDGRADKREILYEGLTEGNPQLRANGLRWGLDNWLYCANGLSSVGTVRSTRNGETAEIRNRDFRILPDTGALDPQTGSSQFGRNRDDWGNWFGVMNANPLYHYALPDHYLRRNPHFLPPDPKVNVSVDPGQSRIFAVSQPSKVYHLSQAGKFTSANSAMLFRDTLWGEAFYGNSFVSEPVNNLIHREIVSASGVTFSSHRPHDEQDCEFLASADSWFRPTTLRTGPDGALWIADMYRETIEHPQWIPPELLDSLDLRAGSDRGRIYRVYPVDARLRETFRLDQLDAPQLAARLETPNGTVRDLVQRRIVTRNLPETLPVLQRLARRSPHPATRLQALCTIAGLWDEPDHDLLRQALVDAHPGVRREAIRLCETAFPKLLLPRHLLDDPSPAVRLQAAFSLGESAAEEHQQMLAELLIRDYQDPFIHAAVMSSLSADNLDTVFAAARSRGLLSEPTRESLFGIALGLGRKQLIAAAGDDQFQQLQDEGYAAPSITATAEMLFALQRHRVLTDLVSPSRLSQVVARGRAVAFDTSASLADRQAAVRLLASAAVADQAIPTDVAALLTPQVDTALQLSVVDAVGATGDQRVPGLLVADWRAHSPAVRQAILAKLLERSAWTVELLAHLEKGKLALADVDTVSRNRLLSDRNASVRNRASKLFAGSDTGNRSDVVAAYQSALNLDASPANGEKVFGKRCASCHRIGQAGNAIGPDLTRLTNRSPQALLPSILDPNRVVEPKYLNYAVVLNDGRVLNGMILRETSTSITLADPQGKEHSLVRSEIEELASTEKSLMPEGVEKDLSPQDLADVMAFIQAAR